MRSSRLISLAALGFVLVGIAGCGAIDAQREAVAEKKQTFEHRVDFAHIWVTTESPPPGKPYTVLGPVTYTEPFTPDAIDAAKIKDRLKTMAFAKWPDTVDAIVKEDQTVSADGAQVTVTAEAIKYDSSVDRDALHKMNDGLIASPSNQ